MGRTDGAVYRKKLNSGAGIANLGAGDGSLGTRIGWVAGSDLFLDPTSSYLVAQALAGTERLPVSQQSLRHSLRERGFLVSIDAGRQMLLVRRTLEGRPRQVLHLKACDFGSFSAE
jgi:hypothetical protein